jgi:hypothetical protein
MTFIFEVSTVSLSLLVCADTALTYWQTHLSLWFLSDVLSRRVNNTVFHLVHLYEFLWGCPVVLRDLRGVGVARLLPHLLHWLCGPCRTLASYKIIFQAPVSLAFVLEPVTPFSSDHFHHRPNILSLLLISKASCRVHTPYIPCTNKHLIIPFSSPGSFRNIRTVYLSFRFLNIWLVLQGGVINTTPNPQPGGPGYLF